MADGGATRREGPTRRQCVKYGVTLVCGGLLAGCTDESDGETGRVYPSGDPVQGPIMNLFQLEMTAKQLYPERFGEWPDYTAGESYPEIPEDERLFDRGRVADVVNGAREAR